MAIFSLEALEARSGDSLLLHWSDADDTRLMLIDGGFIKTYNDRLRRRLGELRDDHFPPDFDRPQLDIDQVVVSHIDNDHISGVARMFRDIRDRTESGDDPRYRPLRLWHNSFDEVMAETTGGSAMPTAVAAAEAAAAGAATPGAVAAGVKEGRELQDYAEFLNLDGNPPFPGSLAVAPFEDTLHGLEITVVGPTQATLDLLKDEFEKVKTAPADAQDAMATAFVDTSVPNRSSIVLHVKLGEHTMLLTGDARGDDTFVGLKAAGLLDADGRCAVDLLKVPHHGSKDNVEPSYFERLPASHYVISANGRDNNPDTETLQMIVDSQLDREYKIHLTHAAHAVAFLEADQQANNRNYEVVVRPDDDLSIVVDLGDSQVGG